MSGDGSTTSSVGNSSQGKQLTEVQVSSNISTLLMLRDKYIACLSRVLVNPQQNGLFTSVACNVPVEYNKGLDGVA